MTKHQPDAELKSFYREARSWADDRNEQSARTRRAAWIVAIVATTIAALEAIALAGLVPLKTVVPYTVLVDRQTGHVTTLDPAQPVRFSPVGALAKSMLAQYVTARESLDRSTIANDYRKIALWSGEAARSSYLALMKPGNPDNPLVRFPRQMTMFTRINSVSLLDDGQAMVRFDLIQRNEIGAESRPAPYVSVIRYRFRDRPLAESDRFINPLGFEVVRYRRDPEIAPVEIHPATAVQNAAPQSSATLSGADGGSEVRP